MYKRQQRTRPLSPEVSVVQMDDRYRNNVVITDLSEKLLEEEDLEPVSYTHLDVYKRQPQCHAEIIQNTIAYTTFVRVARAIE